MKTSRVMRATERATLAVAMTIVSACMHISEQRTNKDVPLESVQTTEVRPNAELRLSWADESSLMVQATTFDACTLRTKQIIDRTVYLDHSVENFRGQMIATGVVAGIFGGTALILASSSKTEDNPATPEDEEADPHGAAVAMGWTAAGVVAFSAIWAIAVAARSGVSEEHERLNQRFDERPTLCNERPSKGEKLIFKANPDGNLFRDTPQGLRTVRAVNLAAGTTNNEGQLRIDPHEFEILVADGFRFRPTLEVRSQSDWRTASSPRRTYELELPKGVYAGFDARLRRREAEQAEQARQDAAEQARQDAAEEKAAEREAQKERAAARARGECEFDGENGVECELRLCAKIAAKVRAMEPTSCMAGGPLDSYQSDWGRATRAILNFLGVLQSRGDMATSFRVQQRLQLCKTPDWFRSCSN